MCANSPSGPSSSPGTGGFPAAGGQFPGNPPPWQPGPVRGQSRGLTFLALALAAVATVLAVVGWFRPVPTAAPAASPAGAPTYTEQQIADAKAETCGAFESVRTGTILQAQGGDSGGQTSDEPAMRKAQAANARLSLVAGSVYLLSHLKDATPATLAEGVRGLASQLMDIAVNYLAGAKNADPPQAAIIRNGDHDLARIAELCK